MGQVYHKYTYWEQSIMVVLHIYVALPMFLLLFDHQDIESESCEMEIGAACPMLTHKNMKDSMEERY